MKRAPAWKPPPTLKVKTRSGSLCYGYGTHAYGGIDSKKPRSPCPDTISRYASLDGTQLVAVSDYAYDQYGRPTALVHHQDPAAPLAAYNWAWEGGGDTVEVVHVDAASGPQFGAGWMLPFGGTVRTSREVEITPLPDHVWTFDTAFIGHLVQTTSTDGTADYQYDPRGQLLGADYTAGAGLLNAVGAGFPTSVGAGLLTVPPDTSAGAGLPTVPPDEFYTYDANGNRTNPGYITGDHNRLLSDGTYDYEYDAEGNRTRRTEIATGEVTEYHWDHRNRLVRVTVRTTDDGLLTTDTSYAYDYLNRWIARSHDPDGDGPLGFTDTYFVYDGMPPSGSLLDRVAVTMENTGQIVLHFESDAQGDPQLAHRYLWGPAVDQILADEQVTDPTAPGNVVWPLTDHLNTVRDLAACDADSDTTTIVNHLIYDAYGRITSQSDPDHTTLFAFTARPFDQATSLQNNLNRWYDAEIGRWLSEDPIGFEAGDANLYRYVFNSVVGLVDPWGTCAQVIIFVDPTNMPADFDVEAVQRRMGEIFSRAGLEIDFRVILSTTHPGDLDLGMTYDRVSFFATIPLAYNLNPLQSLIVSPVQYASYLLTRKKVFYAHHVTFVSPNTDRWIGQNVRGTPNARINNTAVQRLKRPGGMDVLYANIIVHEVFYHGLLGRADDPAARPGTFPSTRAVQGTWLEIDKYWAGKLRKALQCGCDKD